MAKARNNVNNAVTAMNKAATLVGYYELCAIGSHSQRKSEPIITMIIENVIKATILSIFILIAPVVNKLMGVIFGRRVYAIYYVQDFR